MNRDIGHLLLIISLSVSFIVKELLERILVPIKVVPTSGELRMRKALGANTDNTALAQDLLEKLTYLPKNLRWEFILTGNCQFFKEWSETPNGRASTCSCNSSGV